MTDAGSKAKKYNNIKLAGSIVKGISSFTLILLFVWLGLSRLLYSWLCSFSQNEYFVFVLFLFTAGLVSSVIFFPADYFLDFYLEHKYSLSNQTFLGWIWEDFKEFLVSAVIGVPIMLLFFYIIRSFGSLWWLPFSALLFIVSVLLAKIAPVVILPLFYKITPLDNDELGKRLVKLSKNAGMTVENVYVFNMSKNTKKANAAFTGLGSTKRILLGDTLVNSFTPDEIETVIAHELGHYKYKHIIKNIIIGAVSSFFTFYLMAVFYDYSLGWFGFAVRTEIPALPLLALWAMAIGTIQIPLTNMISRRFEYQADEYSVRSCGKKEEFISSLNKLTKQNLADEEPHPFVEWFFYSHPSINNRIRFIKTL